MEKPAGVELLVRLCRDVKYARTACEYLEELGHEDRIPAATKKLDFQAMAEMCNWLTHPNEFGRPPDTIECYDTRELYWPPTDDRRSVWLFKFRYKGEGSDGEDVVRIGMVGAPSRISSSFLVIPPTVVTFDISPEAPTLGRTSV
jgi:hypothetical protein